MITPEQMQAGQQILKSSGLSSSTAPSAPSTWYSAVKSAGTQPTPTPGSNTLLDNPVTRGIQDIFPGKAIGNALGTAAFDTGQMVEGKNPFTNPAKVNGQPVGGINPAAKADVPAEIGDAAQGALTVAAPGVGEGAGTLGRIGGNAALGAGLGASNAVANDKGTGDVAEEALGGAALGGGLSAAGEGVSSLVKSLPARITKLALPKLRPGTEESALNNIKLGSMSKMLDTSKSAVSNLGQQVQSILSHPDYANETGEGNAAITKTLASFPNSNYTPDSIVDDVKSLVPDQAKIVDKISAGTATLQEKNDVRSALDQSTESVYTKLSRPPESKAIGKSFADALRTEVQNAAPESKPVFQKLSQELNLRKALDAAKTKNDSKSVLGLYDIVSALGGFASGGPIGSLMSVGAEKLARSPEAQLGAAKGVQAIGKLAPAAGKIIQGTKAPIMNAVLSGSQ